MGARTENPNTQALRMRAYRERKKKKALLAHTAELAAIRISKGLLPALTPSQKVEAYRQRRKALQKRIQEEEWFSPPIDRTVALRLFKELGRSVDVTEGFERLERDCRIALFNLNCFVIQEGVEGAQMTRVVFNNLVREGMSFRKALDEQYECRFEAEGETPLAQQDHLTREIDEAREKWGNGQQIFDELQIRRIW